jgi:hypothetical protein
MIESDYTEVITTFGIDRIRERILLLKSAYELFIEDSEIIKGSTSLPIQLLTETVLNYFVDIRRRNMS